MNFDLNETQVMLADGVNRLLADGYDFERRAAGLDEDEGWSREQWRRFADMGLLGLPFSEEQGGFGGGPVETMIVMEAFGRALVVEPYLSTVVIGAGLLALAGTGDQIARYAPRIVAGDMLFAFAHSEPDARYDLRHVETAARRDGDGWILDGHKQHVLGGDSADLLIVSARLSGDKDSADGLALFLVDPAQAGVRRRGYRMQDHSRGAEIWLDDVRVGAGSLLGEEGRAAPLIERIADRAIAALCCEAVGALDSAHERTLEYLKTRKQFGRTLGSFQALQHRAADIYVQLELARSIAIHAMLSVESEDAAERSLAASTAKAQIGATARMVGREAVQMHGGIGLAEEHPIGHYYRKLTVIDTLFGDSAHHMARVADAGGLIAPAFHAAA